MKKIIIVLLLSNLSYPIQLFSQERDSVAEEMQRLNRLGDSLHKVQLAKDSAFRVQMEETLRGAQRDIEKAKQKEVEEATQQVLGQQEKEQTAKRKTMILATSAFLIALVAGGLIFKRRSAKNKTPQ